jgi:hypothetical protein
MQILVLYDLFILPFNPASNVYSNSTHDSQLTSVTRAGGTGRTADSVGVLPSAVYELEAVQIRKWRQGGHYPREIYRARAKLAGTSYPMNFS